MSVTESPALDMRIKLCRGCQTVKPWREFRAAKKWPDGTMRVPQSRCKPCSNAASERWKRAHPGIKAAYDRRQAERIKADPELLALRRERQRSYMRRKTGADPRRFRFERNAGTRSRDSVWLAPEPFAAWANEIRTRDGVTIEDLAARFGISEKTLREVLKGRRQVTLSTVEGALLADDTVMLLDLYPDLFEVAQ